MAADSAGRDRPVLAVGRARRVGLLGGSFNPAHAGHRHISLLALRRLALDQVWWLVAPHNPLKDPTELANYEQRLAIARAVASHPRIRVSDIERVLGTTYTVDTIRALQRRYPKTRFVWLIGADNLLQIRRWKQWKQLFERVPIAVFPRPTYSLRALSGLAAQHFARARVPGSRLRSLADMRPPAWGFVEVPAHPGSATRIRARRAAARLAGRRAVAEHWATN